jgi:hypothetical protein
MHIVAEVRRSARDDHRHERSDAVARARRVQRRDQAKDSREDAERTRCEGDARAAGGQCRAGAIVHQTLQV